MCDTQNMNIYRDINDGDMICMIYMTRGAPICKITDIPITDMLAMKITDSDTDTDLSVM